MGTSISTGIESLCGLNSNLEAAAIMLVDQPFVTASFINELVHLYETKRYAIVASAYAETLGVPALFDQRLFPQLKNIRAKAGAKETINRCSEQVGQIAFSNGAIDIDTPEQYQDLKENLSL